MIASVIKLTAGRCRPYIEKIKQHGHGQAPGNDKKNVGETDSQSAQLTFQVLKIEVITPSESPQVSAPRPVRKS